MTSSRYPEAAFLAAMTASATHEVRNVLSIIKESAGLIEDLVRMSHERGRLDEEKVQRAVGRIEAQVKRGADLLTNLNRLAHTLDEDVAAVDLQKEVEQVVFLCRRFARKKGHQVQEVATTGGASVTLNPLLLHMALFSAMQCCFQELPEGSAIEVEAGRTADGAVVEFRGASGTGGSTEASIEKEAWEKLEGVAGLLGADPQRAEVGYKIRLFFREGSRGS
jgi:C4-dicarboxylate-specific signal transduction histidine kinase